MRDRIIAITYSGRSIREFSDRVISEGGKVIALPTIEIVPMDSKVVEQIIKLLSSRNHDIIAFLSANAVDVLIDLACEICLVEEVVSLLNSRTIIAIGPRTKMELDKHNIRVDIVPEKYSTQGLIETLASNISFVRGKRIMIPRSGEADDSFRRSLMDLGIIDIDEVTLYNIRTPKKPNNEIWGEFVSLLAVRMLDCLIFTSPSSVKALFWTLKNSYKLPDIEKELNHIKTIIAIGPRTGQELRRIGIRASIAEIHTTMGALELARKNLSE